MTDFRSRRPPNSKRKHYQYEPLHKLVNDEESDYTDERRIQIQTVYIISAIIWIIIIYCFDLLNNTIIILLFLFIPIIIFGFNFYSVPYQTLEVPSLMFSADFISIGFLVVTIIINWYREVDKKSIFGLIVLALILLSLSMIDLWTTKKDFIIVQHVRSALETAAITLLVIIIYKYYEQVSDEVYFHPDNKHCP